ncbi:hypothetical protein EC957_005255 [Mortierella hygrophila]|uniref:Uncharacterized protein n=1 Tax=Mortierella hygrophila TaxID=979708 RepID=A0A9P6K6R0_9FUNG|nr:hypothetical protein EC957_005255 [Mortierella hygrophila]
MRKYIYSPQLPKQFDPYLGTSSTRNNTHNTHINHCKNHRKHPRKSRHTNDLLNRTLARSPQTLIKNFTGALTGRPAQPPVQPEFLDQTRLL